MILAVNTGDVKSGNWRENYVKNGKESVVEVANYKSEFNNIQELLIMNLNSKFENKK